MNAYVTMAVVQDNHIETTLRYTVTVAHGEFIESYLVWYAASSYRAHFVMYKLEQSENLG